MYENSPLRVIFGKGTLKDIFLQLTESNGFQTTSNINIALALYMEWKDSPLKMEFQ